MIALSGHFNYCRNRIAVALDRSSQQESSGVRTVAEGRSSSLLAGAECYLLRFFHLEHDWGHTRTRMTTITEWMVGGLATGTPGMFSGVQFDDHWFVVDGFRFLTHDTSPIWGD